MSGWTHLICKTCWNKQNPDREVSVDDHSTPEDGGEPCCFCAQWTTSGIYVRHKPEEVECKGECS
jgi:hypothetical protein